MYVCRFTGTEKTNQYEELIKVFLRPEEYLISDDPEEVCAHTYGFKGDKDELKRQLYRDLESYTGKSPKWGILTGIRPVKKAGEMLRAYGSTDEVRKILEKDYMIHPSKSSLVTEILGYQLEHAGRPGEKVFRYISGYLSALQDACTAHSHPTRSLTGRSSVISMRWRMRSDLRLRLLP